MCEEPGCDLSGRNGRQKLSIVLKTIPLRLLGRWGTGKAQAVVQGRTPGQATEAHRDFVDLTALIYENFRPRRVKMPNLPRRSSAAAHDARPGDTWRRRRPSRFRGDEATPGSQPSKR